MCGCSVRVSLPLQSDKHVSASMKLILVCQTLEQNNELENYFFPNTLLILFQLILLFKTINSSNTV